MTRNYEAEAGNREGMTTAELGGGGKNHKPAGHTIMVPSGMIMMMMSAPQYQFSSLSPNSCDRACRGRCYVFRSTSGPDQLIDQPPSQRWLDSAKGR